MLQKELIKVLYDKQVINEEYLENEITSLVNDTRKVQANSCFIAIRGENFDGHNAIDEVIAKGAQMIIVEELPPSATSYAASFIKVKSTFRAQAILANQFYQQPSTKLNVVAVTGTNGKTTTSNMISQLLETLNRKTGLIGTIQYKVGNKIYPAPNTTPNALELQHLFHQMTVVGCQDAVIEASSHALALGRLWYTDVDCGIYTNLSREHLDFHGTMSEYAHAKSLLFSQLGQKFMNDRPRLAIINQDDEYSEIMSQATGADIVTYSLKNKEATAYAHSLKSFKGQTHFMLNYNNQSWHVSLPMRGTYNVSNFLAAFLCLVKYYHFSPLEVIEALDDFTGVPGRMQSISKGQPFEVIVDFAHTVDALERVLQELTESKQNHQRLVTLMGHSGGNRDSGARPTLGEILFAYSDFVILTADNPRFESVHKIASEMIGNHQEKPHIIIENRHEAIQYAIEQAEEDDILLFAGKGGESYQVIENVNVPYNEVEVVNQAIEARYQKEI